MNGPYTVDEWLTLVRWIVIVNEKKQNGFPRDGLHVAGDIVRTNAQTTCSPFVTNVLNWILFVDQKLKLVK